MTRKKFVVRERKMMGENFLRQTSTPCQVQSLPNCLSSTHRRVLCLCKRLRCQKEKGKTCEIDKSFAARKGNLQLPRISGQDWRSMGKFRSCIGQEALIVSLEISIFEMNEIKVSQSRCCSDVEIN
jgi:hypothetical protein